jgi:hypothetical protein
MSYGEQPSPEQSPSPAVEVAAAIAAARYGAMPSFTPESLASSLNLDGETPDKQTLIDRFLGDRSDFGVMRAVSTLIDGASELTTLTNRREANEAQEAVAKALGFVVGRQLQREGDICGGARRMTESSSREDIIPPEIKDLLTRQQDASVRERQLEAVVSLLGSLLASPSTRVEIIELDELLGGDPWGWQDDSSRNGW